MKTKNQKSIITNSKLLGQIFLFISVLIIPLIYSQNAIDRALMPRFFALSIFLLLLILTIFFYTKSKKIEIDFGILKQLIFPLFLGYLIFSAISVFSAINSSEAIFHLLKIFVFFIFFSISTLLIQTDNKLIEFLIKLIIVYSLISALIGFYQFISLIFEGELSHELTYKIKGVSAHRNLFSQILLLCLPFLFYGIYIFTKLWKVLSVISILLIIVLITILLTKSVWIALVLSSLITLLVYLNYYSNFSVSKKSIKSIALFFITFSIIISISVIFYSKFDSFETFDKQADWIRNYQFGSSLERVDLWSKSMEMYRENPYYGVGIGNWKINLPNYGTDELRSNEGEIFFQRAHNEFIGILSEIGIIGFLFYCGIFMSAFYYIFTIFFKSKNTQDKILALFLFFGLSSFLIISMLSFPTERIEHSIFLFLILALITIKFNGIKKSGSIKSKNFLRIAIIPISGLLIFAIVVSGLKLNSEIHTNKAFFYRDKQNWNKVIEEINLAKSQFSELDNTGTPLLWYRASANFHLKNYEKSFDDFQKSWEQNPYHIQVITNLASLYKYRKELENAEKFYMKALKVSSSFEDAILHLCDLYTFQNRTNEAYELIIKCNPETFNPLYNKFLVNLLKKITLTTKNEVAEKILKNSIERIYNDEKWLIDEFPKAQENKIPYKTQIIMDGIYLLEIDSIIDKNSVYELKLKYNLVEKREEIKF
ncbi:MAG: hypothetical protein HN704_10730 [Bacteroidetes bacterium]|nr:hypothetical protein [Bacteroidota bacterium]MBT7145019.1 hypothetical protein [Bacteroidota bacterium]MBT7492067.1 hypothetical protein [Bacteroidota bacterium]